MVSASESYTSDADTCMVERYESEAEEALDAVIDNRDSPRVLCNDEAASNKCCHNGYPPFFDCGFIITGVLSVVEIGLKNPWRYPHPNHIHQMRIPAWNQWNQKLTV